MKLHLDLIRYGMDAGVPIEKQNRLALVIRGGDRHVDVMADDAGQFEADTVLTAIGVMIRRGEIMVHLIGEEMAG